MTYLSVSKAAKTEGGIRHHAIPNSFTLVISIYANVSVIFQPNVNNRLTFERIFGNLKVIK